MISNYFFLLRLVFELNTILKNAQLLECFSQEKYSLMFGFESTDRYEFLEFHTGFPNIYLVLREKFARAKKNSVDFIQNALPQSLELVSLHSSDRIITFTFSNNLKVLLYFRGAKSNAVFIDSDVPVKFRNSDEAMLTEIIQSANIGTQFTHPVDFFESEETKEITEDDMRLGKEIRDELNKRRTLYPEIQQGDELRKIISGILSGDFILLRKKSGKHYLSAENFNFDPADQIIQSFSSAHKACLAYLKASFSSNKFYTHKSNLVKRIAAELKILDKKLKDLEKRIEEGDRSDLYEKYANLLLLVEDKKNKGATKVSVTNLYENNEPFEVPLDSKLDVNQNTRKYFEKAKREKISYQNALKMNPEIINKIINFSELKEKIEKTESLEELKSISPESSSKRKEASEKDGVKYRRFEVPPHYEVFVGKDSKQNDDLTLHFAKPNDLWFHARGCPGSHTVLRDKTGSNDFSKDSIRTAAAIAGFFSKAKNAKYVPVAYAEKKYVVKRKGMEPGKVQMMRESIIMVEPGLPKESSTKNEGAKK